MAKPKRRPELVGALLVGARSEARARAGIALDRQTWIEVVGERIAKRTRAGALERGVLNVVVESPVWAQELSLLSEEIRARLATRGLSVTEIRFRSGSVTPDEPLARALPPPARLSKLPSDVEAHLMGVEDPALRATIADAIAHSLGAAEARADKARLRPKPAARGPRSAAPKSDRPDPGGAPPDARSRRNRGAK